MASFVVVLLVEKLFYNASAPSAEKNCDFVYPKNEERTVELEPPFEPPFSLDQSGGFINDRLSISPASYLRETAFHVYEKRGFAGPMSPLKPFDQDWIVRLVLNVSKTGDFGRRVRWDLEKYLEPRIHLSLSRNQAMSRGEGCLVTRNHEMADSMGYLKDRLEDSDILQEYFIPQARMAEFVDGLRSIVKNHVANLLNVTIRIIRS